MRRGPWMIRGKDRVSPRFLISTLRFCRHQVMRGIAQLSLADLFSNQKL